MPPRRYIHIAYPWRAAVQHGALPPARFYAALLGHALRYRLPASRPAGPAWVLAARLGLPEAALAAAIGRLPARPRPDLDRLLALVAGSWTELAGRAPALPPSVPELSALALPRAPGLTVFVFGAAPRPLVVLKVPVGSEARIDREADSLREAEPAAVAPRLLGRLAEARVQEGLAGTPMSVGPLTPSRAARLAWTRELAEVTSGLTRLGAATTKSGPPEDAAEAIERALDYRRLDGATRRTLAAAWRDVRASRCCVLRHRDTSPQNCLMMAGRLAGIVDWELAVHRGGPGFDAWNLAMAHLESGVGLTCWSQERVVETFVTSWRHSSFWRDGRAAARAVALAAGANERELDALEVTFFGSRVGDRLRSAGSHPTDAATAAAQLAAVCAD